MAKAKGCLTGRTSQMQEYAIQALRMLEEKRAGEARTDMVKASMLTIQPLDINQKWMAAVFPDLFEGEDLDAAEGEPEETVASLDDDMEMERWIRAQESKQQNVSLAEIDEMGWR